MRESLENGAESAARSDTFEWLARWGWVSKGVVHGMMGVLALLWSLGERNGEMTDLQGALGAIGGSPVGMGLLAIVTLGLALYALWRFAQAALDIEGYGNDLKGIAARVVCAGIGGTYAVLTFTAASILVGQTADEADYESWTAFALDLPAGPWLVGAFGVGTFVAAGVQLWRAYRAPFLDGWRRNADHEIVHQTGAWVSRFGLAARAALFGVLAWFLLRAAWQNDSSEAKNFGDALGEMAPEPWLLGLVAAGLIAFGVHCFLNAAYHHINEGDDDEG